MSNRVVEICLEQRRKVADEEMWLRYFNQTLFEQGIITERERNQMINKINVRTGRIQVR